MQQRLVLRRGACRGSQRGHWFDALTLAGQQQPGAVVVQRDDTVGVADHADKVVDVGFEPQAAGVTLREIHGCLSRWGTNLYGLPGWTDSGDARFCDSVRLGPVIN